MTTFCTEMDQLARAMRNFLNAVDVRATLTVEQAVTMLEAWHGAEAALVAQNHIRVAEAEGDLSDADFWAEVYDVLVRPMHGFERPFTFH